MALRLRNSCAVTATSSRLCLFFGITSARLAVFNGGARATGILLSLTILNAFAAGLYFKGKSGWCSSICPLLPLQRVYGQTPFVTVPNSHCQPCVACTKNCYDFKPQVAYQADMHDPDPRWNAPRKLFAAALPGFVLGFFTLMATIGSDETASLRTARALFRRQHRLVFRPRSIDTAQRGHADGALRLCGHQHLLLVRRRDVGGLVENRHRDGHALGAVADQVRRLGPGHVLVGPYPGGGDCSSSESPRRTRSSIQLSVKGSRALRGEKERAEKQQKDKAAVAERGRGAGSSPKGKWSERKSGCSLLEVAERNGQPIEAGCRMGVCGADPVAVLDGRWLLVAAGGGGVEHPAPARALPTTPGWLVALACKSGAVAGGSEA